MLRRVLILAALLGGTGQADAQAVTEWRSASGLPVAVVEVAGGEVEHLAVFLPAGVEPPPTLAGFPLAASSRRGGTVAVVTVPAALAGTLVADACRGLGGVGAAAFVLVGVAPARELQPALAALDGVPNRPLPQAACPIAEGGVELLRGSPERIELDLAVPGVDDPRFDLLPGLAGWLRERLGRSFPALRGDVESSPCPRLVLRVEPGSEHPRLTLRRLRAALAELAISVPTSAEAAAAAVSARRMVAASSLDGAATARELAVRLAGGGRVMGLMLAPQIDAATLASLARDVLAGHPGFATLVEQERRAVPGEKETLDNGAVLSWRWVAGETAVAAVAIGGVAPERARATLEGAAAASANRGWAAEVDGLLGVVAVAVMVPASELDEALEVLAEEVGRGGGNSNQSIPADPLAAVYGLGDVVSADALSVALALPEEAEEGREAAVKFFAGLPAGGVRTSSLAGPAGLAWTRGPGAPRLAAAIELPTSVAALVAGEVLAGRLATVAAVSWLPSPSRLVLAVRAEGGASVPELDAAVGKALTSAVHRASPAETAAAARRLVAALFGDAARATARAAAAPFLPLVPTPETLLATDPGEVSAVLTALPRWEALPRHAEGPAPVEPVPTPGVRKSPSRRP